MPWPTAKLVVSPLTGPAMNHPLLYRALAIVGLGIVILLPIALIKDKISERRARAEAVVQQFATDSAGPQAVVGPLLALTCEERSADGREGYPCETAYFTPRTLRISGALPVEKLHRGIYPILSYRAELQLAGEFDWPAPPARHGVNARAWKQAFLVTKVQDPRGIRKSTLPAVSEAAVTPETGFLQRFTLAQPLGEFGDRKGGEALAFDFGLHLTGIGSLGLGSTGDATEVRLRSDWPRPSFSGPWSPETRSTGAQGFEALWRGSSIATGGRAAWSELAEANKLLAGPSATVSLVDPVNVYALSHRATEYAFLFVLFTFTALALTETLTDVRLHPVQYALVGSAVAAFFLLLIALSEHLAFAMAYGIAAAACVALLTFYLRHPLRTRTRTLGFLALFTALYGTLYVLLRREDHALLMGSLLVFGVLAIAMVATRKVDWAALSKIMGSEQIIRADAK